jgi:hypothetical protein
VCAPFICSLGNIVFENEFPNTVPQLDFTLAYASGNLSFIGPMNLSFNVANSVLRLSGDDPDKIKILNNFSFTTFSGNIHGMSSNSIEIDGQSNLSISNSKIQEILVGLNTTGLVSLNISDSEYFEVMGEGLDTTRTTVRNSLIAGRKKMSDVEAAPFLSFPNTSTNDQGLGWEHILPKGYGGLAYENNDIYLTRNRAGTPDADLIITKQSGDSLYYSVSNPSSYVDANYVNGIYAPRNEVVYRGIVTSNTQLVILNPVLGFASFYFDGDTNFYLKDTGNRAYIDVFGTNPANSFLPYISGFQFLNSSKITSSYISGSLIDATGINLKGIPIQQAISGASSTGTLVSLIDDQHNQRLALWHTGTNVTGFYFSGGNGPYYLQNYNKAANGAISYVNKIDLQNSTIDNFNFTSVKGIDVQTGNLSVTNGSLNSTNGDITFLDGVLASYILRLVQGNTYYLKGNNNNYIDFYGSLFDGSPWITGFNADFNRLTISGGSGLSILFSGQGGINVYQSGSQVIISGGVSSGVGGSGESNTVSNLGSGSGLFDSKVGVDLQFKSLSTGSGIIISGVSNTELRLFANTGYLLTRGESGLFYPKNQNPSGYVTTGQTGAFYAASNPSNWITTVNNGSTAGGSGLASTSGPTVTIKLLNSFSGILISGTSTILSFYPDFNILYRTSNPSGFVSGATNIGVGSGIFSGTSNNINQFKNLVGGSGIQISGNSTDLTIIVTGITSSSSSSYDVYQARFFV